MSNRKKIYIINLIIILIIAVLATGCYFNVADVPGEVRSLINNYRDSKNKKVEDQPEPDHGIFSGTPNSLKISSIPVSGQAIDVDISGNYAYLTNDLGVLYIINISDKAQPFITGKCPDIDSANIVIVREDLAFISYTEWIAGENDYYTECGFKIVDITDKEDPEVIGDYNTGNNNKKSVFGLYIEGDYAYLNTTTYTDGEQSNTLEIVDISNKNNPVFRSELVLGGSPANISVYNNTACININYYNYEADEYADKSELLIIDITDRDNPLIDTAIEVPSNSWGIYMEKEKTIYLSSHILEDDSYLESKIQIVDIAGEIPVLRGNIMLPGGAWELDMIDGFLQVSDLTGGVYTLDIIDSGDPFIASRLNTSGTSYDITVKGNYGYIADGFEGLVIMELSAEDETGPYEPDRGSDSNTPPRAVIDIFGDRISDYYIAGTPIIFSALNAFDPEGEELYYIWNINGFAYKDKKIIDHLFEEPGYYDISLEVTDGQSADIRTEQIYIADINDPVLDLYPHDFKIEVEYILNNQGPQVLKDIECLMRVPLSYDPYQRIGSTVTSIPISDEVYDNHWNKLLKFEIDEDLVSGESMSIITVFNVTIYEFDYGNINLDLDYEENDPDLYYYTRDDLYIDSDNSIISNKVRSLIRNETRPLKIAEILYNYIVRNMHYDYDRAENREYEFMSASEILEKGSGVCSDYSILYTAMLRCAGIPARLAAGIPVYTILYEMDKEIDVGHAWVEIKIPGYGWVPVDITTEESFWTDNYFLDIVTERGPGYIYEHTTMDWGSYYYDGFDYSWDGETAPQVEQAFIYRVRDLDISEIIKD